MVLSDVTICYNNKAGLSVTLDSFLQQTFRDFEVIVIDGGSTDGTDQLLKKYEMMFHEKGICFSYISEKDDGRYHAMNKGINLAQGEWIMFMNAGDILKNEDTLERIFGDKGYWSTNSESNVEIMYGDNIRRYLDMKELHKAGTQLEYIKKGLPFSHQSVFTKTSLFKNRLYDQKYQMAGDYEWFLNAYLEGRNFCYIPECVSIFNMDGISSNQRYANYKEVLNIRKKHHVEEVFLIRIGKLFIWWLIDRLHMDNRNILKLSDKEEKSKK